MLRFSSALFLLTMVGCSQPPAASSLPVGVPLETAAKSSGLKTLYRFSNAVDGNRPVGALFPLNGVLYGTTNFGGHLSGICVPGSSGPSGRGCGVVYKISTAGSFALLHTFGAKGDGSRPYAGLTDVNGTLYGTTSEGGKSDEGTVFEITPAGKETVLFSFDTNDGSYPRAGLTAVNGVLYGTTYYGGSAGYGAVFSITTGGSEKVVYSFQGGTDGALPLGSLIEVNGVLYGTTSAGGPSNDGTVFAISSGKEKVLHAFSGSDGDQPFPGLTELSGTLYGTTRIGGAHGEGTIFSVTTSGKETVLHSFSGGSGDGEQPYDGLTVLNGVLYGATAFGGSTNNGIIYETTTSGKETMLASFAGGSGGYGAYANLTALSGVLYGTTLFGTGSALGGTIFGFTP